MYSCKNSTVRFTNTFKLKTNTLLNLHLNEMRTIGIHTLLLSVYTCAHSSYRKQSTADLIECKWITDRKYSFLSVWTKEKRSLIKKTIIHSIGGYEYSRTEGKYASRNRWKLFFKLCFPGRDAISIYLHVLYYFCIILSQNFKLIYTAFVEVVSEEILFPTFCVFTAEFFCLK